MKLNYDDISIKDNKLIMKGDLNIESNTINVIKGQNGCGKTLLLKNISFNKKNIEGEMVLLDQDNDVTFSCVNVLESIAMSDDEQKKSSVQAKIKELGCETILNLNNGKLSGGEQRLINILRCACSEAEILLMDELTNDLDYDMVKRIICLLEVLKETKTIIIVSHDDRIVEIADHIFEIKDGKIYNNNEVDFITNCKQQGNNGLKNNRIKSVSFIRKAFNYNLLNLLTFLIFSVVIFLQVESFKTVVNAGENVTTMPQNQILLCSIYSDTMAYCDTNSILPSFAIEVLGSMNPIQMIHTTNKIKEFYNKPNVELYDLKLDSTHNYMVFPLEYISKDGQESINVLDFYLEKYYDTSSEEIYIDTSEYFGDINKEDITYERVYKLDIDLYFECIDELEKENSLIVAAEAVVLNEGYTTSDFFNQKKVKELANHMSCVCSQEVMELSYQLSLMQEIFKDLKIIITASLILIIVNLMFVKLQMISVKKQIYLLRNYKFDYTTVTNCIINTINNRVPCLILFVLFCCGLIIDMKSLAFSQINFIFGICVMLFCSITYKLENKLIKKYIKKYYRWDAR